MQTTLDDITSVLVFAEVVSAGSYSVAARKLGLSKSAVSKRVSALEERMGVRLLTRTTRRLALTEAGSTLYERCGRLRGEADEAMEEATSLHQMPRGMLRVNAAATLADRYLAPLIPEFLAKHPGLSLEIAAADRNIDPVAEGFDIVLRVGKQTESSLTSRKIAMARRVVVASPAYLGRHGTPREPRELAPHNCVRFTNVPMRDEWRFADSTGKEFSVPVKSTFLSNGAETIIPAVLAGVGLAVLPAFAITNELRNGSLQIVLGEWMPPAVGVFAMHGHQRQAPAKVRAFLDFFTERLRPVLSAA